MKQKCDRTDCFAWTKPKRYGNCCTALEEVPDEPQCPFYKSRVQVAGERVSMQIRAMEDNGYRNLLEYYGVKYKRGGRKTNE